MIASTMLWFWKKDTCLFFSLKMLRAAALESVRVCYGKLFFRIYG